MKKYITLLLLALAFGFAGCEDFLTVIPDSSYSSTAGYKTQADFEQAIAAVYSQQQSLYNGNVNLLYMLTNRSDETNVLITGNNVGYIGGIERFTDDANNGTHAGNYAAFYKIINRANFILDKIDNVTFTDANAKNYIKGEALALRAYSYFNLGYMFGGVPLIRKVLTVNETKEVPRSTQDETFAAVEEDYTQAISLLPASWTGKNLGRVTKYAAMGMLGRLYMFQHQYAKAKTILGQVISSGAYKLETDYKYCFNESHENMGERMWEIQFMGGQLGEGQQFTTGCLPEPYSGTIQPFKGFSSAPFVSADFTSAYEPGDLRKDISVVTNVTWGGVLDTKSYFIRKFHWADVNTPKVQNDWGVNLPLLRYTDVKLMFAEALNEEAYSATGDAFTYLNEVRSRAGLPALTAATVPDKESFRNAIIKERRIEFAFEGLRWMDLIRWGVAKTVMNKFLSNPSQDGGTYQMKDNQVLFPIPFDELNRYQNDKILWQNPGY